MAEEDSKYELTSRIPGHRQVILGGLARIISTTLLIPLDIFQMRLRYPDTWCVKMFRIMVNCKGCPWPYEVLSARMLLRRTYDSLRWGIYYCRYAAHKRACESKGLDPLYQDIFLLIGRAIVLQAIAMGTDAEVRDFVQERKRIQEKKLVSDSLRAFNTYINDLVGTMVYVGLTQDWPMEALKAAMTFEHEELLQEQSYEHHHQNLRLPLYVKVGCGAFSGVIASALLHPLDVFKVRLQLYPEAWGLSLLRNMLRCEGIKAPYTGLGASILRQTTYTTTRLGTYSCLYDADKRMSNRAPGFYDKLSIGVCAGLLGAFVGCPSEIILVRMMADGPVDPYRRYKNIMDAVVKIWRTEGFYTLWRGGLLTMSKSVVISVSQIGTYSQARNYLVERNRARGFTLNLYTSLFSSFITALITLPLDTFKTRYQVVSNGSHRDVYQKFRQDSGVLGLWRGFTPYYLRLAVHTLVTFYLLETLYEAQRKKLKKKIE